jgi:enoyl-CoA hydratase/carnithine racemase
MATAASAARAARAASPGERRNEMEDRVRIEKKDGLAEVRLARPDKLNAFDLPMFAALVDAGLELARDRSLRAVVLSGEGRAFSSGLDIQAVMSSLGERKGGPRLSDASEGSPANHAQRAAWVWQEVPVPVIAAVHGVAYGAGLQLALGADIRFVAPDAKLSIRETYWGLIPDVGLTQTLRNVVGLDVAKELTFTARVVSGAEAKELRLATHVSDDPRRDALALAREIAGRSPDAVRAAKKLLNTALLGSVADGLRLEAELQASLVGRPNQLEAVRANLEKREPRFHDPE